MAAPVSFDILLLGLADPSADGRARFCDAMGQLTGRPPEEFEPALRRRDSPLFHSLRPDQVRNVLAALDLAGARVEIRPHAATAPEEAPSPAVDAPALFQTDADDFAFDDAKPTVECPKCGAVQAEGPDECVECGAVFVKHDRELLDHMARERQLEGAQTRHAQVHEEWVQKAKKFVESNPLNEEGITPFSGELRPAEVPFMAMQSDEGPLLMTSDRLVAIVEGRTVSVPYEMIKDVDVGGGFLQKRGRVRLQLKLHTPLPAASGTTTTMSWQLHKESADRKDVIMDWAFARSFLCGSCGVRDLDYRLEGDRPHARCMHCATDHVLDLVECLARPVEAG